MTDQEINEAVARKLGTLGCRRSKKVKEPLHLDGGVVDYVCADCGTDWPENRAVCPSNKTTPDYCHSIAAAWEIAEKFKFVDHNGVRYSFTISWELSWEVGWEPKENFAETWISCESADTAPMAICLAFLRPN